MGIRLNYQWRICFLWKNSDAIEVEIVDCLEIAELELREQVDQDVEPLGRAA